MNEPVRLVRLCASRRLPPAPAPAGSGEMAALRGTLWAPGQTLRIAFDHDSIRSERVAVMKAAVVWMEHANIRLVQVPNPAPDAEIRIAFSPGGSWHYVGTECRQIPADEPTGNMGWPDDPGRDLHELGHALGLIHEHQWSAIPFIRSACYRYYGAPPNNWPVAEVDAQVLDREPTADLITSPQWDGTSIMEYPIPPELVSDPRFVCGWNQALSPTDVVTIGRLYPATA